MSNFGHEFTLKKNIVPLKYLNFTDRLLLSIVNIMIVLGFLRSNVKATFLDGIRTPMLILVLTRSTEFECLPVSLLYHTMQVSAGRNQVIINVYKNKVNIYRISDMRVL